MPFELLCSRPAPELHGVLHTYQHRGTGLKHHHLATDHVERSFALAFPTPAFDNQGKAHVLEHMALCGSHRYPTHDPFMAMNQRSLASFQNAITYGDRTVYTFCTPDPTDFENLLSVYLDAIFSPLLRPESFSQEAVRLETDDQGNPRLEGVVYHEMKGALADPDDIADRAIRAALLPGTPYAVESGGTPAGIRTLTLAAVEAFYREHYHPAHAVAISHGSVDIAATHRHLEEALAGWQERPVPTALPLAAFASSLTAPVFQTVAIPGTDTPEEEDGQGNQTLVKAWALGPTFEHDEGLIADFVMQAWAAGDASPLNQAMSEQGYGRPSTLTFAQTEEKHALFSLAMDGLTNETRPLAERLIADSLQTVATEGLPAAHLEAVFAGFETFLRERGNDREPLGIELILEMLPPAMAEANPLCAVDPGCLLARHADLTNPAFIAHWVRTRLLENPAHAVLTLVPDPTWFARQDDDERAFLAGLTPEAHQALLPQTTQHSLLSADCLPCVDLDAVSPEPLPPLPLQFNAAGPQSAAHVHVQAPTHGLLQVGVAFDLTTMDPQHWPLLEVLWSMVLHLGETGTTWQEAAAQRTQGTVGLTTLSPGMLSRQHDGRWLPMLQISAKALERRSGSLVEVLHRLLTQPDFSDTERLGFLVESEIEYFHDSVGTEGDRWARLESQAVHHEQAQWQRAKRGRPLIDALQRLHALLESDEAAAVELLTEQWQRLMAMPALVFSIGEDAAQKQGQRLARRLAPSTPWDARHQGRPLGSPKTDPALVALTGTTPVNFCHQSWPAPRADNPDAPLLELASRWMEHGFLLGAVREKGSAYGATATIDDGIFSMASYRDPRLVDTFDDFEAAVRWASTTELGEQALREAKISTLQRMSNPRTPQQHAVQTLALFFTGTTIEQRRGFRQRLLNARAGEVQRAARVWLEGRPASRRAFTDNTSLLPGMEAIPAWPAPEGRAP
jgi:hypothetical protein